MKRFLASHTFTFLSNRKNIIIAVLSCATIALHLIFVFSLQLAKPLCNLPLWITLIAGGFPLVYEIIRDFFKGKFGADMLAALAIIVSIALHEYLAGSLVVFMLSGGAALENFAVHSASSVLQALAKRMPSSAHRRDEAGNLSVIQVQDIVPGDVLAIFPHEVCPVDGVVVEGHGTMDEAFLTGEPFQIDKAPGSAVISGAVNGAALIVIRAQKKAEDSRYEKIIAVMRDSENNRPPIRRLADQLGAFYTPLALTVASAAWLFSGKIERFLSVLVIATPCPLLIGIPVVILGAVSLAAKRAIIIKNVAVLEQIDRCEVAIFDKTGTLTSGEPKLVSITVIGEYPEKNVLKLVGSLERYSKHPLARAIILAAQEQGLTLEHAREVSETPGQGLKGIVYGLAVQVGGRRQMAVGPDKNNWPVAQEGLECLVKINGQPSAVFQFRDTMRPEGSSFINHLKPQHELQRILIVSGDRESEVSYLAKQIGISEIHAGKTPEQKLEIVRAETEKARTLFVGDGINDAPALLAATVGIAIGKGNDITGAAAGAVIMDSSLTKVDELMHIGIRMRRLALQSAVGGMGLSVIGMLLAAFGFLPPVWGAVMQEVIDLAAILNALRMTIPPKNLSDF